jgi:hypothetical protein
MSTTPDAQSRAAAPLWIIAVCLVVLVVGLGCTGPPPQRGCRIAATRATHVLISRIHIGCR